MAWWGDADSERPTIVCLHEGLGSVAMWKDVPAAIAERTRCRVMAYSRFGHGASDPPAAAPTVEFMHNEARLLPAILDAAGIERPVLLGHSDGASIALIFAATHPARPHALILEAPHVFVEDMSVATIKRRAAEYETTDLRRRLAKYHRNVDLAFYGWSDVWLHPDFVAWNLEALLPRIVCPVLLIQGADDAYGTFRQLDAIAQQVAGPTARLDLADCGHSPHRDQREAVLDAVAGFIDRWT